MHFCVYMRFTRVYYVVTPDLEKSYIDMLSLQDAFQNNYVHVGMQLYFVVLLLLYEGTALYNAYLASSGSDMY